MGVVVPLGESKDNGAGIQRLVELTRADMERVNRLILSKTGSAAADAKTKNTAATAVRASSRTGRPCLWLA